ncbi:MAG: diguanylate cyclase [Candidatus Polarisedimenticolia bacterium]
MPDQSIWLVFVGGFLSTLGALLGIWAERRRLQFVMRDQAARNSELSRRLTDREVSYEDIKAENSNLSSFLVVLPDVVRRLNSNMAKRGIPPLLASTLEQIFEPAQIMVFFTQGRDQLVLTHGKGLPDTVQPGFSIFVGQGMIGMCAAQQRVMEREDFQSDSRFRQAPGEMRDPAGVSLDLMAPMVNEGRTLGLVCVGRPLRRHRDDKKMIKLVADLGSLALSHQHMISALESMANRDSLTNLCTKRFLNLRLGHLIHQAQTSHASLSVILFDIDHFKKFNDTYGHLAGDEILKKVAALLRAQLRADDIPARYGGEEFVVVLPNTSKEDAVTTAEKIRRAIESSAFPLANGHSACVTISGGVAALTVDGSSSQEVLSAADQALYLAKEQGRNRIVTYRGRYLCEDGDTDVIDP